jgi:hypothetical protein
MSIILQAYIEKINRLSANPSSPHYTGGEGRARTLEGNRFS